jgi:hypothetical protein
MVKSAEPKPEPRSIKLHPATLRAMQHECADTGLTLMALIDQMWEAYRRLPAREKGSAIPANADMPPNLGAVLLEIAINPRAGEEILAEMMIKHAKRR